MSSSTETKRKSDTNNEENLSPKKKKEQPNLVFPAAVWARIFEYLLYSDVASLALVASFFLKEAFPLVKTLFIDSPQQLVSSHAKRFPNAESIFVLCRSPAGPIQGQSRIVPFLKEFEKLQYCFVGCLKQHASHPMDVNTRLARVCAMRRWTQSSTRPTRTIAGT